MIIESMPRAKVISVAPERLVSGADHQQAFSLWIKRQRCNDAPFPHPVMKLSDASPLWRWHEVVSWLLKNSITEKKELLDEAVFVENLNLVLEELMAAGKKCRIFDKSISAASI